MLDTKTLLKQMLEHFPKWMDIRKRASTAVGGQLAEVIAEETAAIQLALDEFKKDFFIESYFGKEEDIVDFVLKLQVGDVDIKAVEILSHQLIYTNNLDIFYKQPGFFYYEDDYLFFKIKEVGEDKIEYALNGFHFLEKPEKMHVWNIFDEFAAFVGLQRHLNETNAQLKNRIMNVFKDKINNSKDGLKHAILTELMEIDPTLTLDEIIVEGVTPENLRKKYDEFNTILDKLSSINKDSYKHKKWDIDPWYYSIKSIDYIPHAWDVALEAYKDGVGAKDDLSIVLSSPNDTTDATILFYKNNVKEVDSYLQNANLKTNIELELIKYKEELRPIPAKYKITASKVEDITNKNIRFEYSDVSNIESDYYVMDIIAKDENGEPITKDVTINDYTLLPKNKSFKLKFKPRQAYKPFQIMKCDLKKNDSISSLLKETKDFTFAEGRLKYKHCKLYAERINDFLKVTNLIDTQKGLAINTTSVSGEAILRVNNMNFEKVFASYGCDSSPVRTNNIITSNFDYINDKFVSYSAPGDTKLTFEIQANSFEFNSTGSFQVRIFKDNVALGEPFTLSGEKYYKSHTFKQPSLFKVELLSLNNLEQVKVYNIKYTNYKVEESLTNGEFIYNNNGMILPNIDENEFKIKLTSFFDKSPYIENIYIGSTNSDEICFETEVFQTTEDTHIYINKEHLYTELVFVNSNGIEDYQSEDTNTNFTPYLEYVATSNSAYIELDLKSFVSINKIISNSGAIKSFMKDGIQSYLIELKKNNKIFEVTIAGVSARNIKSILLIDLFGIDPSNNDKLYVTNLFDGFIACKNNVQTKHRLSDIKDIQTAFKYGMFYFDNLPIEFNQLYIKETINESVIVSNNGFNGSIKEAMIKLKDKQVYIAYNEHKLIQKKRTMIQIEDTFNPFIPDKTLLYYDITNMSPNIDIQFHDFDEMYYEIIFTNNTWSVGKKYICLEALFDINDSNNHLSETIKINKEYTLRQVIPIDYITELDNGSTINLCKYVIKTPDKIAVEFNTIDPNTSPIEHSPDYYGVESMFKQADGFNKLQYCNIDQILEFFAGQPNTEDYIEITNDMYSLLKEEGIIVWNSSAPVMLDYSNIYIKYTIKKPNVFVVEEDLLYEKTNYRIEGYSFIKKIQNTKKLSDGDFMDLSEQPVFKSNDRLVVQCTNPSFDAYIEPNGIRFKRTTSENVLYAKSGYYYVDGLEYYMFAEETTEKTDKIMNVVFYNVLKNQKGLNLQKASNNYINNSLLFTESIGNVFSTNLENNPLIEGASALNSITACNSFNHWNAVGCNLTFADGLNGVGINFSPFIKDGYAYIKITNSLFEETLISFFKTGGLKGYIGIENKNKDMKYPNTHSIKILSEISSIISNKNIVSHTFSPEKDHDYFLVIKGQGMIDDIIVCDTKKTKGWDYHKKNISALGFRIEEKILEDYTSRLFFYNTKGYKNIGAEIDKTNTIVNSSLINWGLTKIKAYDKHADWKYCVLKNVDIKNNMVVSKIETGYIETEPIFIGNKEIIESLTVKLNDVEFEQTSGFTTTIYSSEQYDGIYESNVTFSNNIHTFKSSVVNNLKKYIKLKIQMPANKIINSLEFFLEYRESKNSSPVERISSNGELLSEIYDAQYQAKYKLADISINKLSNNNDVQLQIRAARANKDEDIWTNWYTIELDNNLKIKNNIVFEDYRFFQLKISLKKQNAFININYLDLKVVR